MNKKIIILFLLLCIIIYNNKYEKFNVGGQEINNLCSEYCTPNLDKDYCIVLCNKVSSDGDYKKHRHLITKDKCNPQDSIKSTSCKTLDGLNTSIPINPIWCPSNCIPTPGYDDNPPTPTPTPTPASVSVSTTVWLVSPTWWCFTVLLRACLNPWVRLSQCRV